MRKNIFERLRNKIKKITKYESEFITFFSVGKAALKKSKKKDIYIHFGIVNGMHFELNYGANVHIRQNDKKLLSSFFRESWFEKEKGGCYE